MKYLTDTLASELKDSPVRIGAIQPGMVLTDMLIGSDRKDHPGWEKTRRVFNILADRVEDVTPWIAQQVLDNQQNGRRIRRLTTWKAAWRFLTFPLTKRDVVSSILEEKSEWGER